jgi:subfamily B ATP-binding cassette protein MsbA
MLSKFLHGIDPVLLRLAGYAKPYKWQLLMSCFWMVIVAGTTAITSKLLGMLTEQGFYERDTSMIVTAPVALIVITLFYAVALVMSNYTLTKVSQSILVTVRTQMYSNMLRWPMEQYQKLSSGEISSKFVNEANIALGGAAQAAMVLVRDFLQLAALFSLLLWQNWQLTLVTCVVGPLAAFLLGIVRKRMRKVVHQSQEAIADTLSCVQEAYGAQRVIKVSGTYQFENQRFGSINEAIRRTTLKKLKLSSMGTPITQVVTMMGVAVVVTFALIQAKAGLLSVGDFITFLSAMLFLMQPLQSLAGLNATFTAISVAAKSVFSIMDAPLQQDAGTVVRSEVQGNIDLCDVYVRYPESEQEAIKGINLSIKAGEHVALIGHSGSGKTTTVNLLPRFVEASSGVVKIDGVDVRDFTLENLRKHIAIVSQDVFLFDATIRENVAYGFPQATEDEINAAIRAAALEDVIKNLPNGLDSTVGEGGRLLSGGQKQRVSIARAFLKNAPLVILDEATSALDSESEHQIKQALTRLLDGRTCLIVAHRLSVIDNVDRIVALHEGRIVEEGTPAELLTKDGVYSKFCRLQKVH